MSDQLWKYDPLYGGHVKQPSADRGAVHLTVKPEALTAALGHFKTLLQASQRDLEPEAAKVLRDNLWSLYDSIPDRGAVPAKPERTERESPRDRLHRRGTVPNSQAATEQSGQLHANSPTPPTWLCDECRQQWLAANQPEAHKCPEFGECYCEYGPLMTDEVAALGAGETPQPLTDRIIKYLREIERHCPCGARPESPKTHPHVGGCPVEAAIHEATLLECEIVLLRRLLAAPPAVPAQAEGNPLQDELRGYLFHGFNLWVLKSEYDKLAALLEVAVPAPPDVQWKEAALLTDRTRAAIRERRKAGESIKELAEDYGVPGPFVDLLCAWQMCGDEPAAPPDVQALRIALRDLIDAIPSTTLEDDPALHVWVNAAEAALAASSGSRQESK